MSGQTVKLKLQNRGSLLCHVVGLEYEQRNGRVEEKSQFQLALHDEFWGAAYRPVTSQVSCVV